MARMIDELLHVSANLRSDGGGAAHFGRLCGWAMRRYCAARRLRFRGLQLAPSDFSVALDGYRTSGGSKARTTLGALALQLRGRRTAIFFDHPGPARLQGLLPAALRAPHAVAILGIDAWHPFDAAGRRAFRSARSVVAISAETARRSAPFLPDGCRVRIVHPGIEPPRAGGRGDGALLAKLGEGYILIVGRMVGHERYKGHEELLSAVAALIERGSPVRLVLAGDGGDRSRLQQMAASLGIADRTFFTGAVDPATLSELYRRAALFAMPSQLEGFGLVYVEAMAAAKPCVALAGTAPAEIILDGETGRLVPAGDSRALADAMSGLLGDPDRACALGAAGRRRYEQDFTAEAFARRFEPTLDELVAD
jgi:glycosyltransferase involved in cell wall biosynthesis